MFTSIVDGTLVLINGTISIELGLESSQHTATVKCLSIKQLIFTDVAVHVYCIFLFKMRAQKPLAYAHDPLRYARLGSRRLNGFPAGL